jgi:hypothetical protein
VTTHETQRLGRVSTLVAVVVIATLSSGASLATHRNHVSAPRSPVVGGAPGVEAGDVVGLQAPLVEVADIFARPPGESALGRAPTGQRWSTPAGEWRTGPTGLMAQPPAQGPAMAIVDLIGLDGAIEVLMAEPGPGTGLTFRFASLSEHWRVVAAPTLGQWFVERVDDGRARRVATVRSPTGGRTGLTLLGVDFRGRTIRVFVDHVPVVQLRDSGASASRRTQVGLVTGRSDAGRVVFRGVRALTAVQ